jgi:hypothetical protein
MPDELKEHLAKLSPLLFTPEEWKRQAIYRP